MARNYTKPVKFSEIVINIVSLLETILNMIIYLEITLQHS